MSLKSELNLLMQYAMELHLKNDLCVFIDMSGHVDWLEIKVAPNRNEYIDQLGSWRIRFRNYDKKYISSASAKKQVRDIIAELNFIVNNKEAVIAQAEQLKMESELKKLAELKKKYGA